MSLILASGQRQSIIPLLHNTCSSELIRAIAEVVKSDMIVSNMPYPYAAVMSMMKEEMRSNMNDDESLVVSCLIEGIVFDDSIAWQLCTSTFNNDLLRFGVAYASLKDTKYIMSLTSGVNSHYICHLNGCMYPTYGHIKCHSVAYKSYMLALAQRIVTINTYIMSSESVGIYYFDLMYHHYKYFFDLFNHSIPSGVEVIDSRYVSRDAYIDECKTSVINVCGGYLSNILSRRFTYHDSVSITTKCHDSCHVTSGTYTYISMSCTILHSLLMHTLL